MLPKPSFVAPERRPNFGRVLRHLFEHGPSSRADLARGLNLTKATMTDLSSELIRRGLVRETGTGGRPAIGRPGTRLELQGRAICFLGAEIGVDRLAVTALDLEGRVLGSEERCGPLAGLPVDAVLASLVDLVTMFRAAHLDAAVPLGGLGVSIPGFLARDGTVLSAPLLGWRDVPVQALLQRRFGWPVCVENDANLFAHAEWYLSPERRRREMLVILVSAGVGGGLISGGKLMRGAHGLAGEIGHLGVGGDATEASGRGLRSWEEVVGKAAILDVCERAFGAGTDMAGFAARLEACDGRAAAIAAVWAHWLARGLVSLVYAYDPGEIVVGGELAGLFAACRASVQAEIARLLVPGFPLPALEASRFGADGCAIGGATMMHAAFLGSPGGVVGAAAGGQPGSGG